MTGARGARWATGARWVLAGAWLLLVAGCDAPAEGPDDVLGDAPPSACAQVTCADWQLCCEGGAGLASCIDHDADPLHCGGCGERCAPDEVCSLGACAAACAPELALCARSCVDTDSSREHCGGCEQPCDADSVCRAGLCEPCAAGELVCGRVCVDPATDPELCGATHCTPDDTTRCADDQVCDGSGRCATNCADGFERCGEGCHELATSSLHCGACDAPCALTERCEGGACTCRAGLSACEGECVQLASDARHCGACGIACALDEVCRDGTCTPCAAGELDCESACIDPLTDPTHCGADTCAPQPCSAATRCVAGRCVELAGASLATGAAGGCVRLDTGEVACWGDDTHALVNAEATAGGAAPALRGVRATQLALGDAHACALDPDAAEVHCWGRNHRGQASPAEASEAPIAEPAPVELPLEPDERLVQLVAAAHYTCALTDAGRIFCWGRAPDLVDASGAHHAAPIELALADIVELAAGREHACALSAQGRVWCWGSNLRGQLGVDIPEPSSATPVLALASGAVHVSAGDEHTCAVDVDATVRCWGLDTEGQVGTDRAVPCGVQGQQRCAFEPAQVPGLSQIARVEAAARVSCALREDGVVLCWGSNALGRAGQPASATVVETPSAVAGLGAVVELASSGPSAVLCARRGAGLAPQVLCWGDNAMLALGDPLLDAPSSSQPVTVALPLATP